MSGPTKALLDRTRRRLQAVILALLVLLVAGIGVSMAVIGLGALDAEVDRAVELTATAAIANLDGELPAPQEGGEDQLPAAADTILLYLGPNGALVADPSRVGLAGLPDVAAVAAAQSNGRDLRTVRAGGVRVRLLTLPITDSRRDVIGYLQTGFVLTLHDRQSASLLWAILVTGGIGVVAAAIITWLVSGRALAPIRRSFEARQRFVADASHELRTPTAIIRSAADVLERERLITPPGHPLVADIIAEADRMGRLVGDLATLATREDAPLNLQRSALDVADLARQVVRRLQPLAVERDVQLSVHAPERAPMIADADRLTQLLLILLDNALDHAPAGSAVRVELGHPVPSTMTLSVADEGPGVAVESRETIFEPFARLSGPRHRRSTGSGLGLAIARRIATAHGGVITAGPSSSGGAEFTVRLPVEGHA